MPRVHCASCGAPSVLGASRCPKCLAPFGAAGPMSGMVLAEEEPRQARPNLPWLWAAALGVVVLLGVGLWAARRGRGTPAPESVVVASDSIAVTVVPRDSLVAVPTTSDAAEAQATATTDATAAISAPPVAARPIPTPAPAPASAPASQPIPRRDPALAPPPTPRSEPARGDTVYRATTWVWLRAGPVNSAEQLGVVNPRQEVLILERRFAWVRVRVEGQEGWMSADYLEMAGIR